MQAKQGDSLSKIAWLSGINIGALLRDNTGKLSRMEARAVPGKSLLLCKVPGLTTATNPNAAATTVASNATTSTTLATSSISSGNSSSPRPAVPLPSPVPGRSSSAEATVAAAAENVSKVVSPESVALLALKAHIDTTGSALPDWQPATAGQMCKWRGISCNGVGKVASIVLTSDLDQDRPAALVNGTLTGTLPPAAVLAPLSELTQLVIGDSPGLLGPLPEDWNQLKQLQALQIFNTSVSGSLPEVWGDLTKLLVLRLWGNQLTGSLPPAWSQFGGKLLLLDLSNNMLNGSLPVSWSGMANLVYMNLYGNMLSGTLPPQWGVLDDLQLMDLGNNPDITGGGEGRREGGSLGRREGRPERASDTEGKTGVL